MPSCRGTLNYDDGKIRLAARSRLSEATLERLRAAGYRWNNIERVFVSSWTPAREDLALALCESLEYETGGVMERAEARAAVYRRYGDEASRKAHTAALRSAAIVGRMGDEPLKVGHHSEARHQSDRGKAQALGVEAAEARKKAEYWWGRASKTVEAAANRYTAEALARRIAEMEASFGRMDGEVVRLRRKVVLTEVENERIVEMVRWARFTEGCLRVAHIHMDRLAKAAEPTYSSLNVAAGDQALVNGHWCVVVRVNGKSARVSGLNGNPALAGNVPYDKIEMVRKMELQDE